MRGLLTSGHSSEDLYAVVNTRTVGVDRHLRNTDLMCQPNDLIKHLLEFKIGQLGRLENEEGKSDINQIKNTFSII